MKEIRTCCKCGCSYDYDSKAKKGSSSRCCGKCTKQNSSARTRRYMIDAAGGSCRACGYDADPFAIMFVSPVVELVKKRAPTKGRERIRWAATQIPLCVRCIRELKNEFIKMKVYDAKARPVKVSFFTDDVTEVSHLKPTELLSANQEIEIVHEREETSKEIRTIGSDKVKEIN